MMKIKINKYKELYLKNILFFNSCGFNDREIGICYVWLDKFWMVYYRNCVVIFLLLFLFNNCIIDIEFIVMLCMFIDWDIIVINLM